MMLRRCGESSIRSKIVNSEYVDLENEDREGIPVFGGIPWGDEGYSTRPPIRTLRSVYLWCRRKRTSAWYGGQTFDTSNISSLSNTMISPIAFHSNDESGVTILKFCNEANEDRKRCRAAINERKGSPDATQRLFNCSGPISVRARWSAAW